MMYFELGLSGSEVGDRLAHNAEECAYALHTLAQNTSASDQTELAEHIADLPSEARADILSFLAGLTSAIDSEEDAA